MSRVLFFALLTAGVLSASAARARGDVAPAPREIRPDGTRDPVPAPVLAKKENPLEVVDRIIKNSKAVGDNLAKTDTGNETRAKQDTILRDIQSLIDQQDDPPPPKPDQNQDMNKDNKDNKDNKEKEKKPNDMNDKKPDMMPMGMNEMPPMKKDMGGMSGMEPMDDQPKGRQPRRQSGEPKEKDGQQMNAGGKPEPKPMSGNPPKDPKNPGGARPDPLGGPPDPSRTSLPFEDEIVKEVWGHLPDKLRQQATQYYKQEFMPRYTELLKHYYSSLSDKGGKK